MQQLHHAVERANMASCRAEVDSLSLAMLQRSFKSFHRILALCSHLINMVESYNNFCKMVVGIFDRPIDGLHVV